MIPVYQIIFYVFSLLLVVAALMVVVSRNPVHSIMFLVLSFFLTSVLWMLLQAEFLSLVLIFVYVGAVMTLFLFVVMMLNIDLSVIKAKFVAYLPFAAAVLALFAGLIIYVLAHNHNVSSSVLQMNHAVGFSNTQAVGLLLFTKYLLPFEVAAAILLVAMISAIALAFHGRKSNTQSQNMREQHHISRADRIRIVKMKGDES